MNGKLPPLGKCIRGRVYRLQCRNLALGVFNGTSGFIGIRTKFEHRYLATEFHWDTGAPFGTVSEAVDMEVDVPKDTELREQLGTKDSITGRRVEFDRPVKDGGRGWYYVDTGAPDDAIRPMAINNDALFTFLASVAASSSR